MHVVLSAFGTRGDVQPLLALALGLVRRGHRATLVAPPDFAEEAREFGIAFHPMGLSIRGMLEEHREKLGANPFAIIRAAKRDAARDVAHQFEAVREAARGADAIMAAGIMWGASSVAEAYKLPYWYLAYAPEAIASDHHPPVFIPFGGLPRFANRLGWRVFGSLVEWVVREPINRQRALLDLAPLDAAIAHSFAEPRAVLAADPDIAPWPADVGGAASPTGWLSLPDHRELGEPLRAFLEAGPPPIYFGFGSMVDRNSLRTTALVIEAARAVKRRALISAGWAGLGSNECLGSDVLVIGSVPHAKLFSRVAAVVHHGGAGTTHAATRAGVPQIVVPHLLDQFCWARRVARLGLGPKPLPRWQLSTRRLIARLEACFADRAIPLRATDLAARAARHDGVANLVRFLEERIEPNKRTVLSAPSRTRSSSAPQGATRCDP